MSFALQAKTKVGRVQTIDSKSSKEDLTSLLDGSQHDSVLTLALAGSDEAKLTKRMSETDLNVSQVSHSIV